MLVPGAVRVVFDAAIAAEAKMVQIARQKELRNLVFPRDLIDQQPSGMIGASLVDLPPFYGSEAMLVNESF